MKFSTSLKTILKNQQNFRDLGGIPGKDGRKIKSGLLFRSGDLCSLDQGDISTLEGMDMALIIDLRAARETTRHPDPEIATIREVINIRIHDAARDQAEKFFEQNDALGLERVLLEDYRRMVVYHRHDFRLFLEILASTENLPLVYHCAAGKDRTGLATVFLLSALGADSETIKRDYMKSNLFTREKAEQVIRKVTGAGRNGDILRPLMEVRESYLNAALDEIGAAYGGLENYVKVHLKADCRKLQDKYLTE